MRNELALALLAALCLYTTTPLSAEPIDNCAACKLVTPAEMSAIMGELKGEAKCDTGVHPGEVTCNFDNMSGAWVKIYMYNQSDDQFSFDKNMLPNQLNPIPGLGNDAFSTKVGTDACVYIRKGNTTLLVSSSGGLNFAKQTAQKAFARLK